jgi:ribose transport system ATP-binding protein
MSEVVLEVRNVSKAFPGVQALDYVSFGFAAMRLWDWWANAPASHLLKILISAYQPDEEILVSGQAARPRSVKEAGDYGLAMVFQEQSLLSNLTVREHLPGQRRPFIRYGIID